jgi:hypothetical protein
MIMFHHQNTGQNINIKIVKVLCNCMLMFHHQNTGQNINIKIVNKSFAMWQSSNVWKQYHKNYIN